MQVGHGASSPLSSECFSNSTDQGFWQRFEARSPFVRAWANGWKDGRTADGRTDGRLGRGVQGANN
jgi:hypothetical protein